MSSLSRHSGKPTRPGHSTLGPLHVPVEAKRCGHGAIAIAVVAIAGIVTLSPCQKSTESQQPDVADHETLIGWHGR